MASQLSLKERLKRPMKQPKELYSWSKINGEFYDDDRALNYYYSPTQDLGQKLNLLTGFKPGFQSHPGGQSLLNPLLKAIQKYEEKHGKLGATLITWRGLLSKIITATQPGARDHDPINYIISGFDGQIFMCQDPIAALKSHEDQLKIPNMEKFTYAGFNFEKFATLPKPWGECSRDDVEARYKGSYESGSEYCVLLQGGVGSIKVAYGAEVDCTQGYKDPARPLNNYVELKTSKSIKNAYQAGMFEQKLRDSWAQSFLAGVPKIVYAFRENNFDIASVEEYETTKIPSLMKRSGFVRPDQRWDGNDAISFYAVFLSWITDSVKDGKNYRLTWDGKSDFFELTEVDKFPGVEEPIVAPFFAEWRESLAKTAAQAQV